MPYPEGDEEPPAPGTEDPSRPDGHWLPSLPQLAIDLILSHIEHNEIVCNVKLVGRGTHRLLFADARYRSVRMRSRIPQHALDAYWARPDAIKSYTLDQRHRMLCATAANGCVANMASLVKGCGCLLHTSMLAAAAASGHLPTCQWMREQGTDWDWTVLAAAARAGHLQVCVWLLEQACPFSTHAMAAAAAAGHLDVCTSLLRCGCPWDASALAAAARVGHRHVCELLVSCGCHGGHFAAAAQAARGGHVQLMEWLLDRAEGGKGDVGALLAGAAAGCGLEVLQKLQGRYLGEGGGGGGAGGLGRGHGGKGLPEAERHDVVAAAAGSRTGDWRAKVLWLLAEPRCYPRGASAFEQVVVQLSTPRQQHGQDHQDHCQSASGAPTAADGDMQERLGDAMDAVVWRLQWLEGQGFPVHGAAGAINEAAVRGQVAALRFLLGRRPGAGGGGGGGGQMQLTTLLAAGAGQLPSLQVLHEHGYSLHPHALREAAKRGDLPMVAWLADAVSAGGVTRDQQQQLQQQQQQHNHHHNHHQLLLLSAEVFSAAARSGSWELMRWLRARGCAWGPNVAASAAAAGCGEQLEWLAAEGCPLGDDGTCYLRAGRNGDLATLCVLRRLGCVWGRPGEVFTRAVGEACCSLAVLRWMRDAGCPVDWGAAMAAAAGRRTDRYRVASWIAGAARTAT